MEIATMPTTAAQRDAPKRAAPSEESANRQMVRALIDAVGFWQQCEHRQCRRMQSCVQTRTCETKYADDILWWKREHLLPYLRAQYPTVQWGAPASIVESQIKAARAAEADQARGKAQGKPGAGGRRARKRRRKAVPWQPLYVPPDFADGAGGAAP